MLEWVTVERAKVGTSEFVLARHGEDWVVRVDNRVLMSNRVHQSEIELAEQAIERVVDPEDILIGGLGLGYTLRAALDVASESARVTVVELVPELVDWNRRLLPHLNDHPLEDPRCEVIVGDAFAAIARARRAYDVIVLDVDNGPIALSQEANQRLYGDAGTRACWEALRPGGILGVWSAGPSPKYSQRLARFGFDSTVEWVPARLGARAKHVLFFGAKPLEGAGGPARPTKGPSRPKPPRRRR